MQDELQVVLGVGIGQKRGLCKCMCIIIILNGILLLFPLFLHAGVFQEYNNFMLLLKQIIWIQKLVWERICKKLGPNGLKLLHSVTVITESDTTTADTTKKTSLFLSENSNSLCSGVFILEDYMAQHRSTHCESILYSGLKKFHTKLAPGKNAPSRS